ncbi:MAG: FAD-dependent monooxygenase, partial [Microbispora sp.]|nr:FAD-dependent monooxygenase [Microbispora sp.]
MAEVLVGGATGRVSLAQRPAQHGEREALAGDHRELKSRGVGPLALEALQRRGLGEKLTAHQPERAAEKARDHGSEKNHFAWIHKVDPAPWDEPGRRGALIWPPDLEAVLAEYASGLGVPVLREHTVTAIDQDGTGVTVTVETPGGRHERRAAYVVGCDGGRSTIRKLAGFDFPGTPPLMTARSPRGDRRPRRAAPAGPHRGRDVPPRPGDDRSLRLQPRSRGAARPAHPRGAPGQRAARHRRRRGHHVGDRHDALHR